MVVVVNCHKLSGWGQHVSVSQRPGLSAAHGGLPAQGLRSQHQGGGEQWSLLETVESPPVAHSGVAERSLCALTRQVALPSLPVTG